MDGWRDRSGEQLGEQLTGRDRKYSPQCRSSLREHAPQGFARRPGRSWPARSLRLTGWRARKRSRESRRIL